MGIREKFTERLKAARKRASSLGSLFRTSTVVECKCQQCGNCVSVRVSGSMRLGEEPRVAVKCKCNPDSVSGLPKALEDEYREMTEDLALMREMLAGMRASRASALAMWSERLGSRIAFPSDSDLMLFLLTKIDRLQEDLPTEKRKGVSVE